MCMYLIVIHDSVERLYPHGVNISIQNYPFGAIIAHVGQVTHNGGEETCKIECVDDSKWNLNIVFSISLRTLPYSNTCFVELPCVSPSMESLHLNLLQFLWVYSVTQPLSELCNCALVASVVRAPENMPCTTYFEYSCLGLFVTFLGGMWMHLYL